jgi:hypothetical protein
MIVYTDFTIPVFGRRATLCKDKNDKRITDDVSYTLICICIVLLMEPR